jgi:hypothetical protein
MKKRIILISGIVLIIASVIGIFEWKNLSKKALVQNQNIQQIDNNDKELQFEDLFEGIKKVDVSIPDTSNWKEYEDENIGYKSKFPKGWIVQSSRGFQSCLGTISDKYGIEIEGSGHGCPIQVGNAESLGELRGGEINILMDEKRKYADKFSKGEIGKKQVLYINVTNGIRTIIFENGGHIWYMGVNPTRKDKFDELVGIANGIIAEFQSTK